MKLGFVGLGVVGGAVHKAFAQKFETVGYDVKTAPDTKDDLLNTDIVFLSLPTPTVKAEQDQMALQQTCAWLSAYNYEGVVVVKSTVLPGTCDRIKASYHLKVVHNPEFLTAKCPFEDFMSQAAVVLGGNGPHTGRVGHVYQQLLPNAQICLSEDMKVTEIAKYMHNLFLATKVGFMNEMYDVCSSVGVSYDQVLSMALSQGKIGETHTKVPNVEKESGDLTPKFGYAGQCFPKDIQALLTWSKYAGLNLEQLNSTNEANLKRRPESCLK